ncbi:MAG: hypothetical protein U1F43_38025 [Myxococcota bacterium]
MLVDRDQGQLGGGLPDGVGRSLVLTPTRPATSRFSAAPVHRRGEALWSQGDPRARTRVLSARPAELGLGDGQPFDWWVATYAAGVEAARLPAAALHVDPACGLWQLERDSLQTETRTTVDLVAAPSCGQVVPAAAGDLPGLLALHPSNALGAAEAEVLAIPTAAHYQCADEMVGTTDSQTCGGVPEWNQYLTGTCPELATVVSDPPTFTAGATAATLTITDYRGNSTTCATKVVIEDRQAPVIDCGDIPHFSSADARIPTGLPLVQEVAATDDCGPATAAVVGWRCLVKDGNELVYDVSDSCVVVGEGENGLRVIDLGVTADVLEWTVRATDTTGNERQSPCYATIDHDIVTSSGGGGCGASGADASLALALGGALVALARGRGRVARPNRIRPSN